VYLLTDVENGESVDVTLRGDLGSETKEVD